MNNVLKKRFEELTEQLKTVEGTKTQEWDPFTESRLDRVDDNSLLNWTVKVKNVLSQTCGTGSQHFMHFNKAEAPSMYRTNWESLKSMKAVFFAAKEDFEGGYLASIRGLVQAEVFDSELEQAAELLKSGYHIAAAVIAGVVLESAIRELCTQHKILHGKLDRMNADLAKAGVYNSLMLKRITALAAIRNSAAHGKANEFADDDVKAMIPEIERFLAQHLK